LLPQEPAGKCPRAVVIFGILASMCLLLVSSPCHVIVSRSPVRSGATSPGYSLISSSLPYPFLTVFPPLFPPQEMKSYNTTGLPLTPLPMPPAPSSPMLLASFPLVTSWPTVPLPSLPLSPTSAFFLSLRAVPPHLSPLHIVIGVANPRLLFPSTIWTLMPLLFMTSAQVFFAEGIFCWGWWVFFPLPLFFVIGILLSIVIICLWAAFLLFLFLCIAFPCTIFYSLFPAGAVVGASGRVVS
jgi:hypothetical protein